MTAQTPLPELEDPTFAALMLAGGSAPAALNAPGHLRALIPLLDRPLAAYSLSAIQKTARIDACAVVGDAALSDLAASYNATLLPVQESMLANLITGLTHFKDRDWVLLVSCDTPLLTATILDNLLDAFCGIEADIYYPIIPQDVLESKYPGGKRTWVTLKGGTFTGGNVFLVRPEAILRNQSVFDKLIAQRKSPVGLARVFGLPFVVKLASKQLTVAELEAKATSLLKASVRALVTVHPEVGIDLDKVEDHVQLSQILQQKQEKRTGFFAAVKLPPP